MDADNDGRFPDDSSVEIRYPRDKQEERGDRFVWPWLPGLILSQCGPDEWYVCVEARELATLNDVARRRMGRRTGNCSTRADFGTAARSGVPPTGRSGDPGGGGGQLAVLEAAAHISSARAAAGAAKKRGPQFPGMCRV